MTGIYAIHNIINDKYYIGQTKNIKERWMQHRSRLKCGTHENSHLQASYNKHGECNFEYLVIEECQVEHLDGREMYYIEKYDSYNNGYNQDKGGAGCRGYKHTEEEILKMRKIQNPKAVLQLDLNLKIVNEWISCSHAGKTTGFSARGIKACCERINRQKTIGGFYWVYKEEYENNTVDWEYYLNIQEAKPKRVSQYDLNMNLVRIWDSVFQAQKIGGYTSSEISAVCNYKRRKTHKGYIWRFTDSYTEEEYLKDCNTDFTKRPVVGAKILYQYDLDKNLIATYESVADAVRKTGFSKSSIQACLYGKREKSHGSIWLYDNLISQ